MHSRQTALQIYMLRGFMPNSCISLSLRLVNLGNESGILLLEIFLEALFGLLSHGLCAATMEGFESTSLPITGKF